MEGEGAYYHVINRGNYRRDIFGDEGAKQAFLACLEEACEKSGWVVHAWCVMSNHYHLALETPRANLVQGMKWLQTTFAARFNRYRTENGHLFQGRYKSLYVEAGPGLGALCHYIHLNPVRAKLCGVAQLGHWPWTSFSWLQDPRRRALWYQPAVALAQAGNLADNSEGRQAYGTFLEWVTANGHAQRQLGFEKMSKGWVIGSAAFKKGLIGEHREKIARKNLQDPEWQEAQDAFLQTMLRGLLRSAKKTETDAKADRKGAAWKVELAGKMKEQTTATNRWLTARLHLGSIHEASRKIAAWSRRYGRHAYKS